MHRFHLSSLSARQEQLEIRDPRILHQAFKVLRMKPKDFFQAFNGEEGEFLFQIESISRKLLLARRLQPVENRSEAKLRVTLYQAIPKKPALFELIIQKATELGVEDIYPLITERTEKRRLSKFERLSAIAMEATEQSRRLLVPNIHHPITLEAAIPQLSHAYMGYEYEKECYLNAYGQALYSLPSLQLVIGPEGGFSQKEIGLAQEAGVKPFTMGPRILRMETAALSALSLILLDKRANAASA